MIDRNPYHPGPNDPDAESSFGTQYFQIKERIIRPDGKEDWVIRPLSAAETAEARRRLAAAMEAKHGRLKQKNGNPKPERRIT